MHSDIISLSILLYFRHERLPISSEESGCRDHDNGSAQEVQAQYEHTILARRKDTDCVAKHATAVNIVSGS